MSVHFILILARDFHFHFSGESCIHISFLLTSLISLVSFLSDPALNISASVLKVKGESNSIYSPRSVLILPILVCRSAALLVKPFNFLDFCFCHTDSPYLICVAKEKKGSE